MFCGGSEGPSYCWHISSLIETWRSLRSSALTGQRLELLVERELYRHVRDAKERGDQALVESTYAFVTVYLPDCVNRVPVPLLVWFQSLCLYEGRGGKGWSMSAYRRSRTGSSCTRMREQEVCATTTSISLTMNRVLMTQSGFVNIVPVAPPDMAAIMCTTASCWPSGTVENTVTIRVYGGGSVENDVPARDRPTSSLLQQRRLDRVVYLCDREISERHRESLRVLPRRRTVK